MKTREMGMIATREGFGEALVELGERDWRVVSVEADISKSTRSIHFSQRFPDRFFNVGCAEQNAIGVAAGMAACGLVPFVSTYAVFASMRACEQIRTTVAYAKANVKICPSHGGVTPGDDGVTHQATEDLGIMRTIPNLTVIMPSDYHQMRAAVFAAAQHVGPVYIRGTRDPVPQLHNESIVGHFVIGRAIKHCEGGDVALIAIGDMVSHALRAAEELGEERIQATVLEVHTLKPLDQEAVLETARCTGAVVTVEDHNIMNGLGSAVAELLVESEPLPMRRIGLRDTFAESGPYLQLLKKYGLAVADIKAATREVIRRRDRRQ
jgi:transketolase